MLPAQFTLRGLHGSITQAYHPLPCSPPPHVQPSSLCMVTCPAPGGPTALAGAHSRRREEAGLASYFPGATRSIPPLVDVPQQLISAVLHGGVSPRGGYGMAAWRVRAAAPAAGWGSPLLAKRAPRLACPLPLDRAAACPMLAEAEADYERRRRRYVLQ